jgi:hypothetical protein
MTTLEFTQHQSSDNYAYTEEQRHRVFESARNVGAWLVDRFSGVQYPATKVTTVPTFQDTHMSTQEKSDWFADNEYAFGD